MKVIDLNEAKTNLERYATECQTTPVVVTVGGKPVFELIPILSDDPDLVEQLLATNEAFGQLLESRHKEMEAGQVSSLEAVRERLRGST